MSILEEVHSLPVVREVRKSYRNRILISGSVLSLAVLAAVLIKPTDPVFLAIPGSMLVLLVLMFLFYMAGHRKMKELKAKENWMSGKSQMVVIDTDFRSHKLMASPLWFILYGVLIVATAMTGILLYSKIPDRIPMHWNAEGLVDGWAEKSYRAIMWGPFVQLFMTFIMIFSYWMIGKSKQVVDPTKPEASSEQNRIFRYRWSVYIISTGLALVVMFGIIQFFTYGFLKNSWFLTGTILVFTACILISSIVLSITTGQGGSKLYVKETEIGNTMVKSVINRDEDKFWKLGLIYFNPDDRSLFVERRFGVGWTINLGRPVSWFIIIGFIAALTGFVIVSTKITR